MISWAGAFTGKIVNKSIPVLLLLSLLLMAGCSSPGLLQNKSMMRGFNALQHENVAWDDKRAWKSVRKMSAVGVNSIVFVPFLEQKRPDSVEIRESDAVTREQLAGAIRHAHKADLHIIMKPQMLVPGSWAGGINHADSHSWQLWFDSYSRHIIDYAKFAQQQKVDVFVIGTELAHAANRVDWAALIKVVRQEFSGSITYAAHNVKGVKKFPSWQLLDAVSLTLYPSLGASGTREEMQLNIEKAVQDLYLATQEIDRPLLVLEIGMPSAQGASLKPWEWHGLKQANVDLDLQYEALDLWLQALDKPWVAGVYLWAWYSDPSVGGRSDADFTPQNKPAERLIRNYWRL